VDGADQPPGPERLDGQLLRHHAMIGDPTLADAILDRLVHNSHRIALTGKSRRKPEEAE
jgi:DNA replication protein DnaC